jgi:hypothetical protein
MRAGFGTADITPTPPVWLAGFGARTKPAEDIAEPLEARALVLDDGATTLCLIVCDSLGMSHDISRPIRSNVAAALGVEMQHVMIANTHTHHGPSAMSRTDRLGWPTPEGYLDTLSEGCVAAAQHARDAATDATLSFGRFPLPGGFAFNRRGSAYDAPTFSILRVEPGGIVANLGIHPVLLGPDWYSVSTDWVAPFRTELECEIGGTAIELTGALGDINPLPRAGKPGNDYEPWATLDETVDFGKRLGQMVLRALGGVTPLDGPLGIVRHETIDAPVGGTGLAALTGEPSMPVEFLEWSIGDVRVVSLPGEAFHVLGQEISAGRSDRVLLAGLAPWHGYLPVPWGDGYEEGVSFGPDFVAAIRTKLLDVPL